MTEANQVNGAIRENLGPYGRFKRIECTTELGVPDWYYRVLAVAGWVEAKLVPKSGKPPDHFTLEQLLWGEEETRHGGAWFLLGLRSPRTWVLYDAPRARAWRDGLANRPLVEVDGAFPTREIMKTLLGRKP